MGKKAGKPRGRMSSYAFFVQVCREEHRKKHPSEQVVFADFSKKCSEKWKTMNANEKKRFEQMAEKDKIRHSNEMATYDPGSGGKKRRKTKDPNAPKRALSAFFLFCADERPKVRKANPGLGVGDIAKELGKRWEKCPDKASYENEAAKNKAIYEKAMAEYKKTGAYSSAGSGASPTKKKATGRPAEEPEEDDDEDDDDDDDDDEEEDDE